MVEVKEERMFTYKGVSSKEMHLRVLNEVVFSSPERDVEVLEIPGRDGELILDKGRFKTVTRSVPCRLEPPADVDIEVLMSEIHSWLLTDSGFHRFTWERDPEFCYFARVEGDVVSQRMFERLGRSVLQFRLHPIKYLESSLQAREMVSGWNVHNPFDIDAKPVVRVIGNGTLTVMIDDRVLRLQDVQGGCVIDSERQLVTSLDGRTMRFRNLVSPFPVLKPGDNVVSFSEGVEVFVTPRLGALV